MNRHIRFGVVGSFVVALAALVTACAAEAGPTGDGHQEPVAESASAVTAAVTCTSSCSGTGGAAITQSCTASCAATTTSVTCDGVVTQCARPPVCTPGDSRSCCAFSSCGCLGDQTCLSSGQWGSCQGSTPRGHVCP